MRTSLLILFPVALLTVAGCSGNAADEGEGPRASESAGVEATTDSATTAGPSTSDGEPSAAPDSDSDNEDSPDDSGDDTDRAGGADENAASDTADAAASADPYCTPALEGASAMGDLLDATDRKSTETGVENDGGDVAIMNEAANAMLTAADSVEERWSEAATFVDDAAAPADLEVSGEEATAAFDDIAVYLDSWVRPEAEIAASAGSIAEYDTGVVSLLSDASVTDAAAAGGEGLSTVLAYTIERCGELPDL